MDVLYFSRISDSVEWSERGIVIDMDLAVNALQVEFPSGERVIAYMPSEYSTTSLRNVCCASGNDPVRIDACVERDAPFLRATKLILVITNSHDFNVAVSNGSLTCELDLVSFVGDEFYSSAFVPTPPPLPPPMSEAPSHSLHENGLWKCPLFQHQTLAAQWMSGIENGSNGKFCYTNHVKLTDQWFLNVDKKEITSDPDSRRCSSIGGVYCDGTGTGKTATVLFHMFATSCPPVANPAVGAYATNASLVILPIHLVSQWTSEIGKFIDVDHVKVVSLTHGKDLKTCDMQRLLAADIVITTFNFLRSSKPYGELLDREVKGRTRASFSVWSRVAGKSAPIIEAVHWKRIVVDNFHSVFESSRDVRHLKVLKSHFVWGVTGTPDLEHDPIRNYQIFFADGNCKHPNAIHAFMQSNMKGTPSTMNPPTHRLRLIEADEVERISLNEVSDAHDMVQMCTTVDVKADVHVSDHVDSIEGRMRTQREGNLQHLQQSCKAHERALFLLRRSVSTICTGFIEGDSFSHLHYQENVSAMAVYEQEERMVRLALSHEQYAIQRQMASAELVSERLNAFQTGSEVCSICMERKCDVITSCVHAFCSECVRRSIQVKAVCPTCRSPLTPADVTGVLVCVPRKLLMIKMLILSLSAPTILFVQWKRMVHGMTSYLRGSGIRVLLMDGNVSQRASTLQQFEDTGGVLLLCLESPFEGLHLAHASHIIFAHAILAQKEKVRHLEAQAVARCVRHGQTREVMVYSFVVQNTMEETAWRTSHVE